MGNATFTMSNREAADLLERICLTQEFEAVDRDELNQALWMAIDALDKESWNNE